MFTLSSSDFAVDEREEDLLTFGRAELTFQAGIDCRLSLRLEATADLGGAKSSF
jgi:hypothetical protein